MKFIVFLCAILLAGCVSTAKNMNHLSVGMNKSEVIEVLGDPLESRAADGVEYLVYNLRTAPSGGAQAACGVAGVYTIGLAYLAKSCQSEDNDYFVQFKNGKMAGYGRASDFNLMHKESTINVNQTIKEAK
jgi:hypothetical protein